jgi:hypothetical protein
VLPLSPLAAMVALGTAGSVFLLLRRGAPALPVLLLGFIFVPWLPVDLPPAALVWSGRLVLLIWVAVAAAMAAPFVRLPTAIRRPAVLAGGLAFVLGALTFWQVRAQVPGGDEPHYLVITQSLLRDGDLRIENNHRERHYEPYFGGTLPPDFVQRGKDGEIYSIHAPGVSALVAPVFAIAGYPGTVLMLLVLSALGSALMWHLAFMVTAREDAAWFGWAAVTLSSTWLFHSFTVYPDGPGGLLVLTGVWALLRADQERTGARSGSDHGLTPIAPPQLTSVVPWFWHGVALAALPWMHTRFSVLAGGLGALVLLRLPHVTNAAAKAFAFLVVPAVSFVGWLAYFIAIYGTANPAAPYGAQQIGGFQYVNDGLAGLLFDQGFGLLTYAPALLFGFIGIGVMLARVPWRRAALEHLFVLVPYLIVVTHFPMWWGGRSAPARFFVPVLLWMALPAAAAWAVSVRRSTRTVAIGALIFTAFASAALALPLDGLLAFNEREVHALWLTWLNGSVDLARALPMWWRNDEVPLFRGIAVWLAAALLAWGTLRVVEGWPRLRTRVALASAAVVVFATAGSLAAATMWRLQGLAGTSPTPAQLDVLRRLSDEPRALLFGLSPPRAVSPVDIAALVQIEPSRSSSPGGAGRNDRPLFAVPAIPAGEYRLVPGLREASGWLMIGIGQDQFAIQTVPLAEAQGGLVVRFPVDVRALMVRGDEDARANVRRLLIDPRRIVPPSERVADGFARHAVRYGQSTVFFMDERSYPEPEAFWVGGARSSEIVLQPDAARATEALLLRNGAAENTVLVSVRGWREELRLGPGEERRLQVPLDLARGATPVRFTTSAGFRPSAVDPNSRDHRFLGVWVKVGG